MRAHRSCAALLPCLVLACTSGSRLSRSAGVDGGAGTATEASTTPGKPGPRKGGYIVLTSPEPRSLNPITQAAFDAATPLIFEGLVGLDARTELVPVLAERWERSPDGKTLVFRLRKGVKWHDGEPFTAEDVLFTIESARKNQTIWAAYLASVDKVEAPSPDVVTVTYREPYGADVASFIFGILPKHSFEGKDLFKAPVNESPVGTGPYKFVRWQARRDIVVGAYDGYWGGRPNIDQIEIRFDVRTRDHVKELRENKLDFAEITEPDEWSGELRTPEFLERFETGVVDDPVLTLIAWNCQRKPLDNPKVRVALTHALDRPRVIEDVLQGAARPISGPFFPSLWGADPNVAPWPFDLARARQLLDEAKLPAKGKDGQRFAFELLVQDTYRGSRAYDEMLAIFRNDLEKVGVKLNVSYLPRGEVVDRLILHNFDAVLFRWSADIPDPDPYALLHSSQVNGGENYAAWVNTDADKLLEEGRRSNDRARRKESYYNLHRLLHDEMPYTFLYAPQRFYAWSRRVRGVSPLDFSALPRWPGAAHWSVQ